MCVKLHDYQEELVEDIMRCLDECQLCLFVTATGTGKSFVSTYISEQKKDTKTLIILPKINLERQWRYEAGIKADYITYTKLGFSGEKYYEELLSNYDLIIIDEVHHSGAPVWGKGVEYFINNRYYFETNILGLTATPERWNDEDIEYVINMFNGNTVIGPDLGEAIELGILPGFEYVTCLYKFDDTENLNYLEDEDLEKLSDKEKDELHALINRLELDTNIDGLKYCFSKHLPMNEKRSIIVFCSDIKMIKEAMITMEYIFKDQDVSIYSCHSKKSREENEIEIENFSNDNHQISMMFAVNMFDEGYHIGTVDTVIMFRRTRSINKYLQQIGRTQSTSNFGKKIVIFDIACNNIRIKDGTIPDGLQKLMKRIKVATKVPVVTRSETIDKTGGDDIDITIGGGDDYSNTNTGGGDINGGGIDIKITRPGDEGPIYTGGEDGTDYKTRSEVLCYDYCGRDAEIIKDIKSTLSGYNNWTDEDIQFLKDNYSEKGPDYCAEKLNRTKATVKMKAIMLGLKSPTRWTDEDIQFLKDNYSEKGPDYCAEKLNRTKKSVMAKTNSLGLKFKK